MKAKMMTLAAGLAALLLTGLLQARAVAAEHSAADRPQRLEPIAASGTPQAFGKRRAVEEIRDVRDMMSGRRR